MAVPGIKYDDGTGGFAANCFPVRCFTQADDGESGGAWLVAHKAEQRRRFKAVVCAKPRTYSQIREERKRAIKEGIQMVPPAPQADEEEEKILDGFFLMKHCCVEDPADLCSINISGQALTDVKEEDFCLFDNVAYVNAGENVLPFESFNNFPIIRELELPLNGLRNLKVKYGDFNSLGTLDLSYNNLSPDDLMPLGLLSQLRVLNLTGNYLKTLPPNLIKPLVLEDSYEEIPRYQSLEILMLDDNKLSNVGTFASLAGLRRLQHLSLSKNGFFIIPQLMLIDGRHVTQDSDTMIKSMRKAKSGRSSRGSKRQKSNLSSSQGRKSILKNTPSLEGPMNTAFLKSSVTSSSTDKTKNGNSGEEEHVVKFKDEKGENESGEIPNQELHPKSPTETPKEGDDTEIQVESTSENLSTFSEFTFMCEDDGALESDMKPLEDDLDFGELNLERLDEKIEEEVFQEALEEHKKEQEKLESAGLPSGPQPPPFPELRSLNLSHNQFVDEDALLALAAWPMLTELLIHDNPLTIQHSGNPPLLTRFLQDRLGIAIIRHRPEGPIKPRVEVKMKPGRKVNTIIPPVPRCNVDELLALEAPPKDNQSERSVSAGNATSARPQRSPAPGTPSSAAMEKPPPLPPIATTPREGRAGDGQKKTQGQQDTEDAFFMTQVEDPSAQEVSEPNIVPRPPEKPKDKKNSHKPNELSIRGNYKGFEELLHISSDEEAQDEELVPQDLQSNVKSLQYILDHPLMFRDKPVPLEQPQPPFRPLIKHQAPKAPKPKSKEALAKEVLNSLRERDTVVEASLADVIKRPLASHQELAKDAPRLLTEIQNRYNIVRATSMQNASSIILNANDIMQEAMRDVERISSKSSSRV